MAKTKKVTAKVIDAEYTVVTEPIGGQKPLEINSEVTKEVKTLLLDPSISLYKFIFSPSDMPNTYVGTPISDFVADGVSYPANKFYFVITSDNKTYIVQREFFDKFFVIKYPVQS